MSAAPCTRCALCTLEAVGPRSLTADERKVVSAAAQVAMQRARTDGERALPLCYIMTVGPGQAECHMRRCGTIQAWCEEARAHRAAMASSSNIVFSLDEGRLTACNGTALLVALVCYDHPNAGTFYYDIGTAELLEERERGPDAPRCSVS